MRRTASFRSIGDLMRQAGVRKSGGQPFPTPFRQWIQGFAPAV